MADTSDIPETKPSSDDAIVSTASMLRQLEQLPKDELEHLAEDIGLDATRFKNRQSLVSAIHERRQMINAMDREAMLDVVQWGRRAVPSNASKEQLALEIARIQTMRFDGLSPQGLVVLAVMRGVMIRGDEDVPAMMRKLKRQEGFFGRLNRKRRAMIGSIVSNMLGEDEPHTDYQFLPPQQTNVLQTQAPAAAPQPPGSIKDEIEESGLFGGLASRVKRTADVYLNQKLDEVEARIDRKLDEIDRRLAEWRDKEVANRLRILKITLWASVIVAALSLVYSYVKVYFVR
ncbi:MAG TPA: hypothetical protein VGF52_00805 [Tepidisphaeraceae bacterium]